MMLANEVINMLMAEFDMATAQKVWLEEGHEEGLAEGREEGLAKGIISVAKGLLADGDSIDRIIKVTGLAREVVENLRDAG